MTGTKRLSLHGRLRMAAACPDPNAALLAEAADAIERHEAFRQEVSDAVQTWVDGGIDRPAWIWFRKNGVDIPDSATEVRVQGNNTEQFAAWNCFVPVDVNDYFEIMWSVDNTAIQLLAVAASSPVPRIPSVILTVNYVGYEV